MRGKIKIWNILIHIDFSYEMGRKKTLKLTVTNIRQFKLL